MSASSYPLKSAWIISCFGSHTIAPDLPGRLRELASDLDRLRANGSPDAQRLEGAPLLENWIALVGPTGTVLAGLISGHPRLNGPVIMTSPIWAVGSDLSSAHATSRFYRLGTALGGEFSHEEARHVH